MQLGIAVKVQIYHLDNAKNITNILDVLSQRSRSITLINGTFPRLDGDLEFDYTTDKMEFAIPTMAFRKSLMKHK